MRRARPAGKRSLTGDFFNNHADGIWACDFLQLYDVLFRLIFAFFIVKHGTREVVHFNYTWSPSDRWQRYSSGRPRRTAKGRGTYPGQRRQVRK